MTTLAGFDAVIEGPADGLTALVVHGMSGDLGQGKAIAEDLVAGGMRVVRISRAGYGRTPLKAGYDLAPVVAALGLDAVDLVVGISAGGPPARALAAAGKARRLGLMCAVHSASQHVGGSLRVLGYVPSFLARPAMGGMVGHGTDEQQVASLYRELNLTEKQAAADEPSVKAALADYAVNRATGAGYVAGMKADIRRLGKRLTDPAVPAGVPTLVFHGASDPVVVPDSARAAAAEIPDAHLVMVAGHTHTVPLTARPQAAAELLALVARAPASA